MEENDSTVAVDYGFGTEQISSHSDGSDEPDRRGFRAIV
jgi:hypothetical protein